MKRNYDGLTVQKLDNELEGKLTAPENNQAMVQDYKDAFKNLVAIENMTYNDIDLSDKRVLAVDDAPLNVLLIQKMLGRLRCSLDSAYSGEAALDMIDQSVAEGREYDLVILDILMPGMDGYEVLSRLKANENTANIPVIVLSGLASNDNIIKAKKLGAVDYIQKPILMENLYNTVLKYLTAKEQT